MVAHFGLKAASLRVRTENRKHQSIILRLCLKRPWGKALIEFSAYRSLTVFKRHNFIFKMASVKVLSFVLLLIIACQGICYSRCKTCQKPQSGGVNFDCTSCYEGYYYYDNWCTSCSFCSHFNACSQCTNTTAQPAQSGQQGRSLTYVVAIVITPIVICIVILLIYVKCYRRASEREQPAAVTSQTSIKVHTQSNNSWIKAPRTISACETCAICLEKGVFLETKCHHYYHPLCISSWLKKAGDCPLCKSKQLSPAKIYCRLCSSYYLINDISYLITPNKELRSDNCSFCN